MDNIQHTKQMYDKYAEEYHAKRQIPEKNLWNMFIEMPAMTKFVKPVVRNKTVLDLGCGSGIFAKHIKSWNANVIGCDISRNLISIAINENPKIPFIVCNAEKTPFKRSEFDVVTSGLMLHYFKNLNSVFKEVSRITKRDGLFIFSLTHPFREVSDKMLVENEIVFTLKPYFNNDQIERRMIKDLNVIKYHHTLENIFNALNDNGFVTERIIEARPIKEFQKYSAEKYDLTSKYPSMLIVKARKIK